MATNFEGRRQTAQWWHLRKKTAVVKVTSYKTSQGLAISVLIKRWAFPSIIVTLSCWVSHLWCLVLDNLKNMNPIAPPGCLKMTSLSQKHTKKITKKGKRMQRSRHVFKHLQNRWPLEAVTGGGPDEQGVRPTFSNLWIMQTVAHVTSQKCAYWTPYSILMQGNTPVTNYCTAITCNYCIWLHMAAPLSHAEALAISSKYFGSPAFHNV